MKARYSVPITRREAESFLRANIGNVRLPAKARYLWVAGVHTVTDQAGVYLISAVARWIGAWLANVFFGRVPGGRK